MWEFSGFYRSITEFTVPPFSVCGFTGLSILVPVALLEAEESLYRNNLTPCSTVPPSTFQKFSLKAYQSVLNRLPQ